MQKTSITVSGLCLSTALLAGPVQAMDILPDSISIAYGEDINTGVAMNQTRLGLRWRWDHSLFSLDEWHTTAYIDASTNFLKSHAQKDKILVKHLPSASKTRIYALSPVFRFEPIAFRSWRL